MTSRARQKRTWCGAFGQHHAHGQQDARVIRVLPLAVRRRTYAGSPIYNARLSSLFAGFFFYRNILGVSEEQRQMLRLANDADGVRM